MNQKGIVIFESIHNDNTYQYLVPVGASWQDALKAAAEIFSGMQEMAKKLQEEADAHKSQPIEVTAEVVE